MSSRRRTLAACILGMVASLAQAAEPRPNIVFILCDDLGYGDVSCFGQKRFQTPHVDRLAAEGMRFTQHYSGHNVCAPSRCVLMTGKHPGHAFIRENRSVGDEGQYPVPPGELALPLTLKKLGYAIGGFGKWGLGPIRSTGDPLNQGFDRFYGYNCQAKAHNFYPAYLWDNDTKVLLNNHDFSAHQPLPPDADPHAPESYDRYRGHDYSADLIAEQARKFLRENKDKPFFLYYPTTVPHLALQVPEDSLEPFRNKFDDQPYTGDRRYLPHFSPRAAYAGMITRLDREVGRFIDLVDELGLTDNTIFVFTSDNGPLYDRLGGTDSEFFNSAGGLRGRKGSFYEGGIRVPCIVRWKGHIAPGTVSDRVTGFEDWLPTLLELAGAKNLTPSEIDGISFAPTLLGKQQPPRELLYRESPGYEGQQSLRRGLEDHPHEPQTAGKAKNQQPGEFELYNLADDPAETTNVADQHPEMVARLARLAAEQHVPSELFPLPAVDGN